MSVEGLTQIFATPFTPNGVDPVLDVVFVHGLGGDRNETWQRDAEIFWPQWLAQDFPNCRVFVAGYESSKFGAARTGKGASIQDLAGSLADELTSMKDPVGRMLIVTHSLGGLVVKQMLRRCSDSANKQFIEVGRSVEAVVFLATPHVGASLAATLDVIFSNIKSQQVQQLTFAAEPLLDLNDFFRSYAGRTNLNVRVYYETKNTWGVKVVDKVSANPGVYGAEPIPIEADHLGICKVGSREDKLYRSISALIRELTSGTGTERSTGTHDSLSRDSASDVGTDTRSEYEYFTSVASDDRRSLDQKLRDGGRDFQIRAAERSKERFAMALQRSIAQPSAVALYTRLMADVESRFNRHVLRVISSGAEDAVIDEAIQREVIDPSARSHSTAEHPLPVSLVDGALYYLAGNCHLAFDK